MKEKEHISRFAYTNGKVDIICIMRGKVVKLQKCYDYMMTKHQITFWLCF